jgi:hypothetical protein
MSKTLKKVKPIYEVQASTISLYTKELILGGGNIMNRERNDVGF